MLPSLRFVSPKEGRSTRVVSRSQMGVLRVTAWALFWVLLTGSVALGQPERSSSQTFEGRDVVRYGEFVDALRQIADSLSAERTVRDAHQALLTEHGLSSEELPLQSFSRVRLAFEATRDGGLWDLRWDITNQMPRSDRIWAQWSSRGAELEQAATRLDGSPGPSAIAECDELSALFAILARDMEVVGFVGLHWPVWNHVVAVWQVPKADGGKVRVVVPTSQVFLTPTATLGTRELETRRVVFPYTRTDKKPDAALPGSLARYLIHRARTLGSLSTEELSARRQRLGGS